jgi:hypothetical protein
MESRVVVGVSGWLVFPVLLAPLLAGCGEEHVIQWREHVTYAEGERAVGASCAKLGYGDQISSGTGAAPVTIGEAPPTPSYQLQWDGVAEGIKLTVLDVYGELVEEHQFDEVFLDSGEREEITPAIPGGGLRLTVWGGESCDAIDSSEFE